MKRKFVPVLLAFVVLLGFAIGAYGGQGNSNERGPLEKITFIHYKNGNAAIKANAKPNAGGGVACYTFLSKGARWKTTEPILINPINSDGVGEELIVNATNAAAGEWDNKVPFGIFGSVSVDNSASFNNGEIDGYNTVSFGGIPNSGAIAVTTIWGYFGGPPALRELVEWDMLLDQEDYEWGDATATPDRMDVQNIITHEIGHSAGMGDLYTLNCAQQTMYGYSAEGETSKRDLASGDIAGIRKLYG